MFESLKELSDIIEEGKRRVAKEGEKAVKSAFKDLFDKHPTLESVVWAQYTPYFNDGEPCEFSVHGWSVKLVSEGEKNPDEDEEEDDYGREGYISEYSLNDTKMRADIDKLFSLAGDEAMLVCFGDHAEITATRKGFDVEEYSHD